MGLSPLDFIPRRVPGRPSLWADGLPAARAAYPELERGGRPLVPAWPCSRWGLPGRGDCSPRRWSLTQKFASELAVSPLPTARTPRRLFSVARSGGLPRPGNYPAPCPVECGLSSTRRSVPRSPDRPGIRQPKLPTFIIPVCRSLVKPQPIREWLDSKA